MSDPVTNAEIEDVLSSIRRLVSENAVTEPTATQPTMQSVEEQSEPDQQGHSDTQRAPVEKLVLTPDFRVHEGLTLSDDAVVDEVEAQLENTHDVTGDRFADAPSDDVSPEPEEARETDPWQDQSKGASDSAETPDFDQPAADQPLPLTSEELVETPDATTDKVEWPSEIQTAPQSEDAGPLEDRVAELEAAVSDSSVEFEPDLGDAVEDMGPAVFLRQRAEQAPEAEQNWDEVAAEVSDFVDAERAIDGTAVEEDSEDNDLNLGDDEDTLIDEDMLRDLVVRLVREELQGAVGEKITRSVRRLVRREVERAITLKGLE